MNDSTANFDLLGISTALLFALPQIRSQSFVPSTTTLLDGVSCPPMTRTQSHLIALFITAIGYLWQIPLLTFWCANMLTINRQILNMKIAPLHCSPIPYGLEGQVSIVITIGAEINTYLFRLITIRAISLR